MQVLNRAIFWDRVQWPLTCNFTGVAQCVISLPKCLSSFVMHQKYQIWLILSKQEVTLTIKGLCLRLVHYSNKNCMQKNYKIMKIESKEEKQLVCYYAFAKEADMKSNTMVKRLFLFHEIHWCITKLRLRLGQTSLQEGIWSTKATFCFQNMYFI